MPIVDGLTSTKMIRSFEKATPSHALSNRAKLNGRIPIIAVSASLVEKDRKIYTDAGFDAWILKPILFPRLNELLQGIVNREVRKENIYREGWEWENGGWFHEAQVDAFDTDTTPSGKPPVQQPSEQLKVAAVSDDPQGPGDAKAGVQPEEQHRLMEKQRKEREQQGLAREGQAGDDEGDERWEESVENQPMASPSKAQEG